MELLQEEDVAELIQKKEAQLQLKAEVDEINRQAQAQKIIRAEQEKIQDLKVSCPFSNREFRLISKAPIFFFISRDKGSKLI